MFRNIKYILLNLKRLLVLRAIIYTPKKTALIKLFIITLCIIYCYPTLGQETQISKSAIDSLDILYRYDTSNKGFEMHHLQREWSTKIMYTKGLHYGYLNLLLYHGYYKETDSVSLYIKKMDSLHLSNTDLSLKYEYELNKGIMFNSFFGKTIEAITSYCNAYKCIPDGKKHIDKKAGIETKIAYCYISKKQYNKAITVLGKRLKDILFLKPNTQLELYNYLAMAYQYKKEPSKSLPLHQKALELSYTDAQIAYTKSNITYDYYLQKEYQKAIDSALSIRPILKKLSPNTHLPVNSSFLATYYGAIGDYKNAIAYSNENIKTTQIIDKLPEYYQELAGFYEKTGQTKLALEVKDKGLKISDSIQQIEKKALIDQYDIQLKNINTTKNYEYDYKNFIIKSRTGTILTWLFLSMSLGYIVYIYLKKQWIGISGDSQKINTERYQILQSEINTKENKLSATLIAQEEKIKQLADCNTELFEAIENNDPKDLQKIKKDMNTLIDSLNPENVVAKRLEESEHGCFMYRLQQKHPQLSKTDLKHCLFIHMELSLKEIAELLNVSINTVKNGRYRAKTKINIPDNRYLNEYLSAI